LDRPEEEDDGIMAMLKSITTTANIRISSNLILYIVTIAGLAGLGYYVYYIIMNNMLTIEPFLKPEQLIFMYSPHDLPKHQENPMLFMKSLLTAIHFWIAIAAVVLYFTVIAQLFNPFPLDSGIYILMLDADRLKVLRLKSTTSKVFIYNKKAYFLPKQALRSEGNALYLLYMSNLSRALGNLTITMDDYQSSLDDTLEYLLSEEKRVNRVGGVRQFFPKDVLKRNYNIYIENDKVVIRHDLTQGRKGHFKITRFVRCNIYVAESFLSSSESKEGDEEYIGKEMRDIVESKIVARLVTENMVEEIPLANITIPDRSGGRLQQTMKAKGFYKIVQYIESDMQLLNPALVYDILSYRRFLQELPKYFIGFSIGALPLVLIIVAVLIATLIFMNVDFSEVFPFGSSPPPTATTTTAPTPAPAVTRP
jgi:hypothetical protein